MRSVFFGLLLMVICLLVLGLSSCAASFNPQTKAFGLAFDLVALAKVTKALEESQAQPVPALPDEKIKPVKVEAAK